MTQEKVTSDSDQDEDTEAAMTKRRKIEHIEICLKEDVQCRVPTMFDDIHFIHNALPEIDKDAIELTTNFLGLRSSAPIVIAAMTGGHPETYDINKRLAEAAEGFEVTPHEELTSAIARDNWKQKFLLCSKKVDIFRPVTIWCRLIYHFKTSFTTGSE